MVKIDLLDITGNELAARLRAETTLMDDFPRPDLALEKRSNYLSSRIMKNLWEGRSFKHLSTKLGKRASITNWIHETICINSLHLHSEQVSDDSTRKFLWKLKDGETVESVLIPGSGRQTQNTLCISSQVGCAMGCTFCLTATQGLKRHLTSSEIVGQVHAVSRNYKINKIVFMGMGEPLHNLQNIIRSIQVFTDSTGFGISSRNITVSTSGLVPAMEELMSATSVRLAVSLNASTDKQRDSLMPVNLRWPIRELMVACKQIIRKSTRSQRILFEYVLLSGINDSLEDADRLVNLLKSIPCKINLIPMNSHDRSSFKKPPETKQIAFKKRLLSNGIAVTLRRERGSDILAACGQLKSKVQEFNLDC